MRIVYTDKPSAVTAILLSHFNYCKTKYFCESTIFAIKLSVTNAAIFFIFSCWDAKEHKTYLHL